MTPTTPSVIDKALDKVPIDKLYEDLFQPGIKKAGEALETVIDLTNTVLFPIKLANAKVRLIFKNNIDRYEAKLQAGNKEICQVPEFVGIPLLDKLTYVSNEDITEAFLNLLTKASFTQTVSSVHPSFITAVNDLSSDEAKLLSKIKGRFKIPFLVVNGLLEKDGETLKRELISNLTGLEKKYELDFPDNINLYLNNLERLGILRFETDFYIPAFDDDYKELEEQTYFSEIDYYRQSFNQSTVLGYDSSSLEIERGSIEITDYGRAFIKACTSSDDIVTDFR